MMKFKLNSRLSRHHRAFYRAGHTEQDRLRKLADLLGGQSVPIDDRLTDTPAPDGNGLFVLAGPARLRAFARGPCPTDDWNAAVPRKTAGKADSPNMVSMATDREHLRSTTPSSPAIRIPDLGDARSLPAFDAAMEELSFRYFEIGSSPEMLWPLMEQYLQPMLYRSSLRTYITNDEVDGEWLIEKYISYAGQSLCLLQHSNHHLQRGDLGASEHAALKDFVLDSTREMYGLVVCAILNAGRERPTSFDGAPLHWDRELLADLTSKLNEIVSAQDPNDPIRLAQQMMKGDGDL